MSIGKIPNKILYIGSTNDTDCNLLTKHFVLAKGKNFPTGDGFWYVQTIGYEIKPDGTVRTGKQIAYQYTGTKLFTRDCYNDVWEGWAEYTTKSDLHMTSESKRITINSNQYNIKIDKIGNLLCVCNITLNTVTFNGSIFDVYTDPFDVSYRPKSTCVSPLSINGGAATMEVMMLPDGRINLWNPNYKENATVPIRGTLIWTV